MIAKLLKNVHNLFTQGYPSNFKHNVFTSPKSLPLALKNYTPTLTKLPLFSFISLFSFSFCPYSEWKMTQILSGRENFQYRSHGYLGTLLVCEGMYNIQQKGIPCSLLLRAVVAIVINNPCPRHFPTFTPDDIDTFFTAAGPHPFYSMFLYNKWIKMVFIMLILN